VVGRRKPGQPGQIIDDVFRARNAKRPSGANEVKLCVDIKEDGLHNSSMALARAKNPEAGRVRQQPSISPGILYPD
jgi:hypothetical protein